MKTITLDEPGKLRFHESPEPPPPGPGEATVRIHRVGICGTDIAVFLGKMPFVQYPRILGHELGVEVTAVGDGVDAVGVGDHCAVECYLTCGTCRTCRAGRTNCCESLQCLGVHTDGGMRDFSNLPAAKLHRSERLTIEQLALVEMLGIGKHAVDRANVLAGESVAVLGLGPIGLTVVQFALLRGARVVGGDLNARRIAAARELFPALEGWRIDPEKPLLENWRASAGDEPDVVFDATGNARSMTAAWSLPGSGGRLAFVGITKEPVTYDAPEAHRRELTMFSSRNAVAADFVDIIARIERGEIQTDPWITHRGEAADVPELLPQWAQPESGAIKAMVGFD